MGDVALDYRVPPEDLRPFVTLFYHFRAEVPHFDDVERADHAQLRFRLRGEPAAYHFADGSEQVSPALHVMGPTIGPTRAVATGPIEVVGLGLQPAGWAAMVRVEASTLVNRVIDAGDLFGSIVGDCAREMRAARDGAAKLDRMEALVRTLVARADGRAHDFARAIDAWLASAPSPELHALIAVTGGSRRQVERRCNALYGAPPKVLARKYRALRAAVALASGDTDVEALLGDGFYDQSHLIREVKQFTGLTPRQLRELPAGPLAQLTISGRHALSGTVSPLISDT